MKSHPALRIIHTLLALLLIVGFAMPVPALADPAPQWALKDVNGKTLKLSDFKGKVVILDFWATWCPPCRAEIPHFVSLQEKYKDRGLVVVGISLDEGGVAPVAKFIEQFKINYPVVMGNPDLAEQYSATDGIPTTFVIDRKGNITAKHLGYTDPAIFESEVKSLL